MFDLVHRLSHPLRTGSFTVGICPVHDGRTAGKLAAAIAVAAAQASRHKVLLVESSRRGSLLGPMFGLDPDAAGLYEMLLPPPHNRFDTIHPTGHPNLFLLPSGNWDGHRASSPASIQVEWVHRVLSPHFNGIVMELPPMGELRAREFCHHIPNAVVLVAQPGRVGSWSVRRAVKRLQRRDANLVSSLLSDWS